MTQIMQLLNLAPDLREQLLFLSSASKLNERSLRPIVRPIDRDEQRSLFRQINATGGLV